MRRWLIAVALALPFLATAVHAQRASGLPRVRIGIAMDGPWERNEELRLLFEKEIRDLLEGEFDVQFPEKYRLVADWSAAGVKAALDRLLAAPDVDLVLALGVLASHHACTRSRLPKPVVAPIVLDADFQELPRKGGASGVPNLSYTAFPNPIERDLEMFRKIVPFKKLAVLSTKYFRDSMPYRSQRFPQAVARMGASLQTVWMGRDVEAALREIEPDVDAVYITPLRHLSREQFDRLVQGLIERRLPSFSLLGVWEVRRGVFAGLKSEDTFPRLARRVALNIQRILLGEDAGTLPYAFPAHERLTINMATARAIGVWPPFSVLGEAVLLNEEPEEVARKVSLFSAVQEAVDANLDLAAEERIVAAGEQEVRLARSTLLPRIELSALGRMIDSDRAEASFGNEAERKATASATLNQLLFSEPAWANLTVQKYLQTSREEAYEQLRLDIAFETAVTYLNLLRARTAERIEKENLRLTRSNLEVARVRQSIGISGPAELYRWQSKIATSRQILLRAVSRREQAERALNRLLHRPLDERFSTEEVSLTDPRLSTSDERLGRYVDNPWVLRIFRDFMVAEGLESSVELRRLDAAVQAQRRALASANRAFYAPDAAIVGDVTQVLGEGGEGKDAPTIPGTGGITLPKKDDTDWSVGVRVSLPLLEGGGRFAERRRAMEEMERLRLQRAATRERIEQRIRSAVLKTQASSPSIELSRDAADAARKTLDLVQDSYGRGVVSILDLLDAQNNAVIAEQVASNAVYDFLIDVMDLQRAANRFDFFTSAEARDAWFERLDAYVGKRRAEGEPRRGEARP